MQPTYLPWLGYLAMIEKADQFVFLDNVQFDHRSWQQRNRIKTKEGELWLTVAVKKKGETGQLINEVKCLELERDIEKHFKSLAHVYKKAKSYPIFYDKFYDAVRNAAIASEGYLGHFNMSIIKFLCTYAGLKNDFLISSNMSASGTKDSLLANICEELEADIYLSAPASKVYLDDSTAFLDKGIDIKYHDYKHPCYPQMFGEFMVGMSCIDAFFNIERENLKPLILSGCK